MMSTRAVSIHGFGAVGRSASKMLVQHWNKFRDSGAAAVFSVADSSGVLYKEAALNEDEFCSMAQPGFSLEELNVLEQAKLGGQSLEAAASKVEGTKFSAGYDSLSDLVSSEGMFTEMVDHVFVDCSASADVVDLAGDFIETCESRLVFANKKPVTQSYRDFMDLHLNHSMRYEATCGAGLPIISALDRLVLAGDEIESIEGQLSGTLGYILSAMQEGGKFSDIVREAKALGFTEPDPRDDLSGVDVARKALILARTVSKFDTQQQIMEVYQEEEDNLEEESGDFDLESDDRIKATYAAAPTMDTVKVEALFPDHFADLDLEEFMERLPELDDDMDKRVKSATAAGKFLRYAAVVSGSKLEVGLVEVDETSPLAALKGTDNQVSVKSKWYDTNALVVRGPGAGVEVTAAGVVGDILA